MSGYGANGGRSILVLYLLVEDHAFVVPEVRVHISASLKRLVFRFLMQVLNLVLDFSRVSCGCSARVVFETDALIPWRPLL